jgi:rRNA maturation protein Nop10
MPLETDASYTCPSCGETNALGVDPTAGRRQTLVEDCPVCCRPLVLSVRIDSDGDALVERAERES